MSIRLNKIGNIPDYGALDSSTYMHLNDASFNAYRHSDDKTYPFDPRNLQGKTFAAFNKFTLGNAGNSVTFVGDGKGTLRDAKGDYFCAGMLLDNLFDPQRSDVDTLLGVTTSLWAVAPPTDPQCAVYPMVIWTNTDLSTTKDGNVATIDKYSIISPSYDYRYTTGVHTDLVTVDRTFTLSKLDYKHIYFAWFIGKADPYSLATAYTFKQVSLSLSANSLLGNRPVFDPVMV